MGIFDFSSFNVSFVSMGVLAVIISLYFFLKETKKQGLATVALLKGIVFALMAGILGARLVYVIVYNPIYYGQNPAALFGFADGGFSIVGGLLGSLCTAFIYLKKNNLSTWKTLDTVAPFLILGLGISRIGSDAYGLPISSDALWKIRIDGETFHPAQAYEFLLCYLLFGYLWLRLKSKAYHGQVLFHSLVGFFFIKTVIQFALAVPVTLGFLTIDQLITLAFFVIIWISMKTFQKKMPKLKEVNVERYDIAKTWFYIWALMFFSLIAYYLIHG